jgi:hypothetical protein
MLIISGEKKNCEHANLGPSFACTRQDTQTCDVMGVASGGQTVPPIFSPDCEKQDKARYIFSRGLRVRRWWKVRTIVVLLHLWI